MVEEVEELSTAIEPRAFPGQREALDHGEVGVDKVRTVNRSAGGVAKLACWSNRERARVKPMLDIVHMRRATRAAVRVIRVSHLIRTNQAVSVLLEIDSRTEVGAVHDKD